MHKKKIAAITMAIIISNFSAATIEVLADEISNKTSILEMNDNKEVTKAVVSKFDLYNSDKLNDYNNVFKIDNSKIESITNNGGQYSSSSIDKAIDNNLNTHWETGKPNNSQFTNEVVITFKERIDLNRIVYAARKDAGGKGFAQEFEIYSSLTDNENDFVLVSEGEYKTSNRDLVEIKFNSTNFKRLKFKFKKADQDWASASEFMFYKEDVVADKIKNLFTNSSKNEVSKEFSSSQKLESLELESQAHPLYDDMKEDLENARILLESDKLEYVDANVSKFISVSDDILNKYNEDFKVKRENITSITTNGGQYSTNSVDRAIDENPNTQWHSNNKNSETFTNEIIITLDKLTTIDRLTYLNKVSRGFAKSFDIYASKTTMGETFEKISSGNHSITKDTLEIKFKPTELRRIKLVFKESYEDWAVAYEIGLYKEDTIKDKIDRLFIDSNMSEVNAEFSTKAAIDNLTQEIKGHPLENEFKEKLDIAKDLVDFGKIQYNSANIKKFNVFYSDNIDAYDESFRVPNSNIEKIENNGGHYPNSQLQYAIDEDVNTHWETGKPNSSTFKNEVILTLKEAQVINRLTYKSRNGCKGFANNFSIYISPVSSGDNFQKISEGSYTSTNDMLEISFNPTKARRVKFVFDKANQDWASISDLRLYKQDEISEKMSRLFSNLSMDTVSEEFSDIKKLEELEKEVKEHPLYSLFKEDIEDAKNILQGKIENVKTVVAEQHGDRNAHNNKNLKFGFGNNNQPTGIVAKPGETITVYVDVDEGKPLPQLLFSQQEGSFANWGRTVSLQPGKNVITVPKVTQEDGWYKHSVTPGGPVYIVNPYTEEEQGKAPIIRFAKGVEEFPTIDKNTNEAEFIEFLKEYKKRIDEDIQANTDVMDRKVIDIFELVADNIVVTGTASGAYDAYVNQEFKPLDSLKMYNDHMNMLFEYQGIDGRNEKNDIKYTRENIRLAQPYGYMYAASGHIGVQRDVMSSILTNVGGWGVDHEIGHKMDIGVRTIGEVTNNMLPQQSSYYYNNPDKRIPFESHVYKNVISTNSNKYADGGYFENLAVFWQLEMIYPGYWAKLNSLYRENDITLEKENEYNDKLNKLAYYSSIALELDLTEHFERHGFWVSAETKEFTKQYSKPDKKIWYANYDYIEYDGEGFTTEPTIKVTTSKEGKNLKLNIDIDEKSKSDLMGYEIYKNDELIAFTSNNSFIDTEANFDENVVYNVVAFDKRLNESKSYKVNSYAPSIKLQQNKVTIKLNEEFEPGTLARAYNYNNEEITSEIVIKNGVDSSKKGSYQVEYIVIDEGITTKEILIVDVVSDYEYLSEEEWKSVSYGWGNPRRNNNIKGVVNQDIVSFEQGFVIHANGHVTYNIKDNNYETFEVLVGVDPTIANNNRSSVRFKVIGDGEVLATTDVIRYFEDLVHISVPVKGVKELTIEIDDASDGNGYDHAVIANPMLITNSSKPKINASNKSLKLGEKLDLMKDVTANDVEDGNLTSEVKVESNNFEENKIGRFEVVYKVTDSDNNVSTKKVFVTVSEDYNVKKSMFDTFTNLEQYNNEFKIPIKEISNNAGNYGNSIITNAIDGKINTHWETNKPNSSSFTNEVIFDLGEIQEISKMAFASRRDASGKGFAHVFEVYVSNEAQGDDFYLVGEGAYRGRSNDIVEFDMNNVSARRVKFKFIEADQGWASLSEVSFYKEDMLANKIENELFIDSDKTKVNEKYNTLDKLQVLRDEVKNHPAYSLLKSDLDKAEQIIRSSFPVLNIPKSISTKVGQVIDIYGKYSAIDKEDGDITSNVEVSGKVNFNKTGKYTVSYTVTDSDGNKVSDTRTIAVVNMEDYKYLTDYDWKSTQNSYKSPNKDKAISGNALRLTGEDNQEVVYERGIGAHATSTIIYDLTDKDYAYFTSDVGVDRAMYGSVGSVSFEVYVDGEKKFDSGLMNSRDAKKYVEVDINDAKELKLVVKDGGNGQGSDHASWGNTKLHFANTEESNYEELEELVLRASEYNKESYTEESFRVLEEALNKANTMIEDKISSQEEINVIIEEINRAIKNLEDNIDLNKIVNIKDKYLKLSIKKELNLSSDTITVGDMQNIIRLNVQGAESLDGLQYAKNLESLNIEYNEINDLSPLKNLKKLTDLKANPQIISAGMIYKKDNRITIDYDVLNRKGEKLSPVSIIVRNNKTLQETTLNVYECLDEKGLISFDTTNFDEFVHSIYLVYEDTNDNYLAQALFMFDNN